MTYIDPDIWNYDTNVVGAKPSASVLHPRNALFNSYSLRSIQGSEIFSLFQMSIEVLAAVDAK